MESTRFRIRDLENNGEEYTQENWREPLRMKGKMARQGPTPCVDEHDRKSLTPTAAASSPISSTTGSNIVDRSEVRMLPLGVKEGNCIACFMSPFKSPMSVKCFRFFTALSKSCEHRVASSQNGSGSVVWVVRIRAA